VAVAFAFAVAFAVALAVAVAVAFAVAVALAVACPFVCHPAAKRRDLRLHLPLPVLPNPLQKTYVISTEGGALAAAVEKPLYFVFAQPEEQRTTTSLFQIIQQQLRLGRQRHGPLCVA
jgi:hypothetical protein